MPIEKPPFFLYVSTFVNMSLKWTCPECDEKNEDDPNHGHTADRKQTIVVHSQLQCAGCLKFIEIINKGIWVKDLSE